MAKVSVIIPTYNRESFIERSINSVLNQTYKDMEVLVVDDGSTDNTRDVVAKILDTRVRYFYKENGGVSSARNFGFENSKGVYISFLDSDDLFLPEKIGFQVDALEKNRDYDICYHPIMRVDSKGAPIRYKDINKLNTPSGYILKDFFNGKIPREIHIMSLLFRRECFESLGGFDLDFTISEDTDLILRALLKYKFCGVNKYLSEFVQHSGHRLTDGLTPDCFDKVMHNVFFSAKEKLPIGIRFPAKSFYYSVKARRAFTLGSSILQSYGYMLKAFFYNPFNFKNTVFLFNPLKAYKSKKRHLRRSKENIEIKYN